LVAQIVKSKRRRVFHHPVPCLCICILARSLFSVPPISRSCLCADTSHISHSADMPVIRRGGKSRFTMPTSLSSQKCSSTTFSPRTPRRLAARTALRITSAVHRALIYRSREGPQQQLNGSALTPFPTLLFLLRSFSFGESRVNPLDLHELRNFSGEQVLRVCCCVPSPGEKCPFFFRLFSRSLSLALSLALSLYTHVANFILLWNPAHSVTKSEDFYQHSGGPKISFSQLAHTFAHSHSL